VEAKGVEHILTKSQLLQESDIASLPVVLSVSTRHVLSRDDLALLKPTSFIINTSRGPLIDEAASIDVLREGKITGVSLDVYDIAPSGPPY
jgi:phosphoglycerate dehydrogenase-like enzyme